MKDVTNWIENTQLDQRSMLCSVCTPSCAKYSGMNGMMRLVPIVTQKLANHKMTSVRFHAAMSIGDPSPQRLDHSVQHVVPFAGAVTAYTDVHFHLGFGARWPNGSPMSPGKQEFLYIGGRQGQPFRLAIRDISALSRQIVFNRHQLQSVDLQRLFAQSL